MTYVLLALVVVGGGAAAYLQFQGGAGATVGRSQAEPLVIEGDELDGVGSFESEEGWKLRAGGVGFDLIYGDTGSGAVAAEAIHAEGDGTRKAIPFALARTEASVRILSEEVLEVRSSFATRGGGALCLRVEFSSSDGENIFVAGDVPRRGVDDDVWLDYAWRLRAPRGFDQARVELLALVEAPDTAVRVDDIGLRRLGSQDDSVPSAVETGNGWVFAAAGGALLGDSTQDPVLVGALPIVAESDGLLTALQRAELLSMAEAGFAMTATAGDDGTVFRASVPTGPAGVVPESRAWTGLRLLLAAAGNALVRSESGDGFVEQLGEFVQKEVSGVLYGAGTSRMELVFETPIEVRGRSAAGGLYELMLLGDGAEQFAIRTKFGAESESARELLREAVRLRSEGQPAEALDKVGELANTVPHNTDVFRQARKLRAEVLAEADERIAAVRKQGDDALYFGSVRAMRRAAADIVAIFDAYGERHLTELQTLATLATSLSSGIDQYQAIVGTVHKSRLLRMSEAFEEAGSNQLAELTKEYAEAHY